VGDCERRQLKRLNLLSVSLVLILGAAPALAGLARSTDATVARPIMTREKFRHHLERLNEGDPLQANDYSPGVVFETACGELQGRQAVLDYFRDLRGRLRLTLIPGAIVIDNERGIMGVELTSRIVALVDRVKVGERSMAKGDVLTRRQVVFYGISDGLITSVRNARRDGRLFRAGTAEALAAAAQPNPTAPPDDTPETRPGPIMSQARFAHYLGLFTAFDPRFLQYYDPDVVFTVDPAPRPLHGRQAVLDLYTPLRRQLQESITPTAVAIDDANSIMVAAIANRLLATGNGVRIGSTTLNAGDVRIGAGVVFYSLHAGLITLVRAGISGETFEPARTSATRGGKPPVDSPKRQDKP